MQSRETEFLTGSSENTRIMDTFLVPESEKMRKISVVSNSQVSVKRSYKQAADLPGDNRRCWQCIVRRMKVLCNDRPSLPATSATPAVSRRRSHLRTRTKLAALAGKRIPRTVLREHFSVLTHLALTTTVNNS